MTAGADATPARRPLRALVLFLLGSAVFSVAYCQAPLYYSNQNQYFLHGLANADDGLLREDWLARTRDPTPVFSTLVTWTVRYLHPWAFYLYHGLILGVYAAAMLGLFRFLVDGTIAARRWPLFIAVFVAVHSALARWYSYRWFGEDYPWFCQAGVAGQYVLGGYLQPSAFGVLLVVAVCLFVRGRCYSAALSTALAATFHPSYLLPAGLLTFGFLAALLAEGRSREALRAGALALGLVAPVMIHIVLVFGPNSAATFAEAQDVLVNLRIPHHSRPDRWLDVVAACQIGWIVLALALVRRTRLFLVLAVPFVLSLLLTLAQVATASHTLALLFPWRISAVLVPIATTVVLSKFVTTLRSETAVPWLIAVPSVVVLVAAGVWISVKGLAFQSGEEELAVMEFVGRTKMPGDVYCLPVNISVKKTRGSLSTDFQPLSDRRRDARGIPVDLQRFRLTSGAPIYVDFKAIPYRDTEVLEWRNRIHLTQRVQHWLGAGWIYQPLALADLRDQGITHLVLPVGIGEIRWGCERVYEDAYYRVYRCWPSGKPNAVVAEPRRGLTTAGAALH